MTLKAAPIRVPSGWRLLDDVELMDLPDPEFIIDGVLPRQGIGVLYGPSAACKTTLVAGMMTAVATGRDWFGHRVLRPSASVYVASEDVAGFKTRLRAAKRAADLRLDAPIGVYTFPEPIDLRDGARIATFVQFVQDADVHVELVVVDTYAASMPGAAENSSEDTTLAMTAAQKMRAALGAAVLLVHHTNAGGSRERGHSSMRGAVDTMIAVTPVDDVIHVECSKQRNGAQFEPLLLKLVPVPEGGCVLRRAIDVLAAPGLTASQDKVLKALRDTFDATGATKGEWRSACLDIPERTFHRVAKILVEDGYVRAAGNRFVAVVPSR